MRFSEIHRSLGDISHRMLTVTLRTLEADGMVARTVYAEVPPRVEYRLTVRGESLLPHVFGLVEWARANMEGIFADRRKNCLCVVRMRDTLSVRELCAVRPGKGSGLAPGCRIKGEER